MTSQTLAEWWETFDGPAYLSGAEFQAAITAHLAAILADPETVEAVADEIRRGAWSDQCAQAAIAVIGARLGLA